MMTDRQTYTFAAAFVCEQSETSATTKERMKTTMKKEKEKHEELNG